MDFVIPLVNDKCCEISEITLSTVLLLTYDPRSLNKGFKRLLTQKEHFHGHPLEVGRTYAVESDFIRETTAITLDKKETNQNEGEAIKREVADR